MKKITLSLVLLLSLFLIVACQPQGERDFPPAGDTSDRAFGQNHFDLSCTENSDCFIVDCYGCISKNTKTVGNCLEQIPPDCNCIQNNCRSGPVESQSGQFPGPNNMINPNQVNPNLPLPELAAGVPKGELITKKLNDLEIKYFSTAIARGLTESGTDLFITVKNLGISTKKICFTMINDDFRKSVPSWNLHFFAMQDSPLEIAPQQEKRLWYYASVDQTGYFTVNFDVGECGSVVETLSLPVTFGSSDERFWGKETTTISGTVKDEIGNPLPNINVVAVMNCGRVDFKEKTDSYGYYSIKVFGMEDIEAVYQGKELACDSKDYYLSIEHPEYEFYYNSQVAPTRTEPKQVDIFLKNAPAAKNYVLEWEKQVDDNFGFFWVKPSQDWSVFAAAQSKHPPELNKPTNFYLFDAAGNILWKQPTQNECWGIDIAKDGSKVVAGCHDGNVYLVDRSGKLLWTAKNPSMVRSACISPDNLKVLSGIVPTIYDTATGAKNDLNWKGDWLRNCQFYQDNSGFVAGVRELTGFNAQNQQKWRNILGEFPLFLDVDNKNNVFATGKSRVIFSFDALGNLRWKHRLPDHTATAGAATPDGSRIALGTVGGAGLSV